MNDQEPIQQRIKSKKEHCKNQVRYTYEFKLKAVKLFIEEDYSAKFIQEQLGVGISSLNLWVKKYRESGENGLKPQDPTQRTTQSNPIVQNEILKVKENGTSEFVVHKKG